MEKQLLSDVCEYRKGKVPISEISLENYISTENLIPNKGGLTVADNLPTTATTQAYCVDDVLVSNIRPYFKKIWLAKDNGGCSNDVLVFKAKKNISATFLYYILADDKFFQYSMASSKGTKMPRGDKTAIMQYEVPKLGIDEQKKIGEFLKTLDDKIAVNNRINRNLSEQVAYLYKSWFIDFDLNDGVCPDDWNAAILGDVADIGSGKRPPMKQTEKTEEVYIPLVGAASIMGYTNDVLYDSKILVTGRVGTHGVVQRFNEKCWPSDNTLVITTSRYEFVNQILLNVDYKSMNRGSTQPLITQGDLKKTEIIMPTESVLDDFERIAGGLMAQVEKNIQESGKLSEIRDTLLPKLMSGELDVSNLPI